MLLSLQYSGCTRGMQLVDESIIFAGAPDKENSSLVRYHSTGRSRGEKLHTSASPPKSSALPSPPKKSFANIVFKSTGTQSF